MRRVAPAFAALLLLAWGRTAVYTVDFAEFAAVTRLGEPVAVRDGATEAGLYAKLPWPVESVARVGRGLHVAELPAIETLTRGGSGGAVDTTLTVEAYLTWRVPDAAGAERFARTLGTPEEARRLLAPRLGGRLAAALGKLAFEDLIAPADDATSEARSEKLRLELLGEAAALRSEYGVELTDFRVHRVRYPDAVREALAERVRSERARKAAEYEVEGRRRAAEILGKAEADARGVEARAKADKLRAEGEADAEADRIRNAAHARDREFYEFLQKLKAYRAMLGDTRDVLLLSTRHPLFDLLLNPPAAKEAPK